MKKTKQHGLPSIEANGGIVAHINKGRDELHKLSGEDFIDMKERLGPYELAKAFNRDVKTIYKWLDVAKKEKP